MVFQTILETIADNFFLYSLMVFILLLVYLVYKIIDSRMLVRTAVKVATLELEKMKEKSLERQRLLQDLKDQTLVLTDDERKKLERIKIDNAILTRKMLFHMNEAEERARRLELGTVMHDVLDTIHDVQDKERKLFGTNEK